MTAPEPCENCGTHVQVHERAVVEAGPTRIVIGGPLDPRLYEMRLNGAYVSTAGGGSAPLAMIGAEHTPDRCRSARTRRQETR